jgi:hypothetical protein
MTMAAKKMRLGALETPDFTLVSGFFEPLPDNELRLWNEETIKAICDPCGQDTQLDPFGARRIG